MAFLADLGQLASPEVEAEVLGAILTKPDKIYELWGVLRSRDFYRETHRVVYRTMLAMAEKRQPVELTSLVEELKARGELAKIGGIPFVAGLSNSAFTAAYLPQHVEKLKEYAQRRALISIAEEVAAAAQNLGEPVDIAGIQSRVADAAMGKEQGITTMTDDLLAFSEWMFQQQEKGDQGVLSGLSTLDIMTHGWQPSDLVILAARPSMGKSALALSFALAAALKHQKHVAYFSLEMSKSQLLSRMIANISGIDSRRISHPSDLKEDEHERVFQASDILSKATLYLQTDDVDTPLKIYSKARQIQGRYGLDMIVIDHMHLMSGGRKGDEGNRVQEMSYISRQLKLMAMEFDIPVIALAQLSRAVEGRQDKRPQLSDLRDSGSIEQDADLVLMMYREAYYNEQVKDDLVELAVKKFRNGALGTVNLEFCKEMSRLTVVPFGGRHVDEKDLPI